MNGKPFAEAGLFEAALETRSKNLPAVTDKARRAVMGPEFPTEEQASVQTVIAQTIREALDDSDEVTVRKAWGPEQNVGPLGGVSQSIEGWVEVNGALRAFSIAIYSDDRIEEKMLGKLSEKVEEKKADSRVRDLLTELEEG